MKTVNNFLPEEDFNNLTKLIFNNYFPWYFQPDVQTWKELPTEKNSYFTHIIYDAEPKSPHYDFIKEKLLSHLNIVHLIRVKVNCYPRLENVVEHGQHCDYNFSHKGFILSLNTCNGFTILENKKIASVKNKALFFNPSKLHCSTTCSDAKARFNININYH